MPREHVHAELMRMYASNSDLKFQCYDEDSCLWLDTLTPSFSEDLIYRVKPESKKYRMCLLKNRSHPMVTAEDEIEQEDYFIRWVGEWVEVQ